MCSHVLICINCAKKATHVLVDADKKPIPGPDGADQAFCKDHAFSDDQEECEGCDQSYVTCEGGLKLLPTYPAGVLDQNWRCGDH